MGPKLRFTAHEFIICNFFITKISFVLFYKWSLFSNNNRDLYDVYILYPNVYILAGPCKKIVSQHNGAAARFLNIFSKLSMEPFVSSKTNLTACINCSDFILKVCRRIGQNIIVPIATGFGSTKIMFCFR